MSLCVFPWHRHNLKQVRGLYKVGVMVMAGFSTCHTLQSFLLKVYPPFITSHSNPKSQNQLTSKSTPSKPPKNTSSKIQTTPHHVTHLSEPPSEKIPGVPPNPQFSKSRLPPSQHTLNPKQSPLPLLNQPVSFPPSLFLSHILEYGQISTPHRSLYCT